MVISGVEHSAVVLPAITEAVWVELPKILMLELFPTQDIKFIVSIIKVYSS